MIASQTVAIRSFTSSKFSPPILINVSDTVQLGEEGNAANWLEANHALTYPWINSGGDYLDANGVLNGPTHYTSTAEPGSNTGTATWNIPVALMNQLLANNTAFFISTTGAPASKINNRSSAFPPALHVITSNVAFNPPCTICCWVDASSGSTLLAGMSFPGFIKFDLSGVTGTVLSATLTITYTNIFQAGHTVYADYAKMPTLIHDPARQLGGVRQGLAANYALDTMLRGAPGVAWYPRMDSQANIKTDWAHVGDVGASHDVCISPQFVSTGGWEAYGLTALRMASDFVGNSGAGAGSGPGIISWKEAVTTADQNHYIATGSVMGTTEYSELYVRYLLKIDPDVFTGMTELGVKLPGLSGVLDNAAVVGSGGYSARMEHGLQSASNPQTYRLKFYLYDSEHRFNDPSRGGIPTVNCCLDAGRIYCIEQHIKMNTINNTQVGTDPFDGPIYQTLPDGVLEVWVDGVNVYSRSNFVINDIDPVHPQIGEFFANVFHGGTGTPGAQIHYEFGGICTAPSYIGPPTPLISWRPAAGTRIDLSIAPHSTMQSVDAEQDPSANPNYPANAPWHGTSGLGAAMAYSGGVFAKDFGKYGSILKAGTGHSAYSGNEWYRFDIDTRQWSRITNPWYPLYPNGSNVYSDMNGELYADASATTTIQSQPTGFQSYDSNVILPPGVGGAGSQGALLTTWRNATPANAGSGYRSHILQLDNIAGGWSRYSTNQMTPSPYSGSSACVCVARNKVYLNNTLDRQLNVLDLSTKAWSLLTTTGVELIDGDRTRLIYWVAQDVLVSLRHESGVTYLWVIDLATNIVYTPSVVGTDPVVGSGSAEWVEQFSQFFYFDFNEPNTMFRLTPGANPRTNSWTWSSESITGVAATNDITGSAQYSRFFWSPAAHGCIWLGSWNHPVQFYTPQGT